MGMVGIEMIDTLIKREIPVRFLLLNHFTIMQKLSG
jgi:hypothetical protein